MLQWANDRAYEEIQSEKQTRQDHGDGAPTPAADSQSIAHAAPDVQVVAAGGPDDDIPF